MENINKSLRKMCQMEQWTSKGWKAVQVKYGINIIKEAKDERHNLSHYTRLNSISVILHKELYHLWFSCNWIWKPFEIIFCVFFMKILYRWITTTHTHTPYQLWNHGMLQALFISPLPLPLPSMFNQLQIEKPLIHKIDSSIPFYMPRISIYW